jgi:NAD(P)H dehydrogenase (quinone)
MSHDSSQRQQIANHPPGELRPIQSRKETLMTVHIAVIYYSATGNVHRLAEAVAEGAKSTGADVRLRRAAELAPTAAIDANPAWRQHVAATNDVVPEAALEDLEWADGYALGTPTRFGNVAAQLKQFIDQTGPLWMSGRLADKPATSFTSAINRHGGQESTILALNNVFYHWGAIIVAPGYTDALLYAAGGNPYGTSFVSGMQGERPDQAILEAARYQGRRLANVTMTIQGDGATPVANHGENP